MPEMRVGFIGLGNMGSRITQRIVAAGMPVLGFDLNADTVYASGATLAQSPGSVAAASDVVLLSLPDSHVVEQAMFDDDGILGSARDGHVIVDLSTSSPRSTRSIARRLADLGAQYLDAGISGGAAAAEKGTLTLMVGGEASALSRANDVFESFASKVVHCGRSGTGHTIKLLNNFLNAVTLSATAEVMVAAKKAGLDLERVLDVINASSGVSFASLERFPHIIHGDYLEGGLTNTLMLKDVSLYVELLAELGVTSLNSPGPVASFGLARQLGYADLISNTVVDAIGDLSGGIRLWAEPDGPDAQETP